MPKGRNEMGAHSESLSTREHMSATEYQAASWEAYEQQADPPDPIHLSDESLHAFLHYEGPDLLLPSAAREAIEMETRRRGASSVVVDQIAGLVMLASLSVVGVVVGVGILIP
jgi:hypothetical protein